MPMKGPCNTQGSPNHTLWISATYATVYVVDRVLLFGFLIVILLFSSRFSIFSQLSVRLVINFTLYSFWVSVFHRPSDKFPTCISYFWFIWARTDTIESKNFLPVLNSQLNTCIADPGIRNSSGLCWRQSHRTLNCKPASKATEMVQAKLEDEDAALLWPSERRPQSRL